MWFRSEDRLVSETQSFEITRAILEENGALLLWSFNNSRKTIYDGTKEQCIDRLDLIQDMLVVNDTLIDLRDESVYAYFDVETSQEVVEEVEEIEPFPITTPNEEEIMDYLQNNDKFVSYEEYKKDKKLPKIEKKAPIISTPKELADKLHEYRRANGWNMREASKALGIAPMTAWGWFKGNNIPSQRKNRDILAKALNVRFERDM